MIQNIILAATLIVAFFMCVSAFLWGLRLGKQLGNNQVPSVTINPVKKVIETLEKHETKKEAEKESEDLESVMEYSRETALKAIKSEVK